MCPGVEEKGAGEHPQHLAPGRGPGAFKDLLGHTGRQSAPPIGHQAAAVSEVPAGRRAHHQRGRETPEVQAPGLRPQIPVAAWSRVRASSAVMRQALPARNSTKQNENDRAGTAGALLASTLQDSGASRSRVAEPGGISHSLLSVSLCAPGSASAEFDETKRKRHRKRKENENEHTHTHTHKTKQKQNKQKEHRTGTKTNCCRRRCRRGGRVSPWGPPPR